MSRSVSAALEAKFLGNATGMQGKEGDKTRTVFIYKIIARALEERNQPEAHNFLIPRQAQNT